MKKSYLISIGTVVLLGVLSLHSTETFDAFWGRQKAIASKAAAVRRVAVDSPRKNVKIEKFYISIPGVRECTGVLAMPVKAAKKSLPVVLRFQHAGVRSCDMRGPLYADRAIALEINAHGIENGREKSFYSQLASKELFDYAFRGAGSPETFYFREMYIADLAALNFACRLPEWDGKTLIVCGYSMGGAQAVAVAALDKRVTLCVTAAPAMNNHLGKVASWPQLMRRKGTARETALFFEGASFAGRMQAELVLIYGKLDRTCPPESIRAMLAQVPEKRQKEIIFLEKSNHDVYGPFVKKLRTLVP